MKTCAENHSLCYKICIRRLFSPDVNFAFNGQKTELNSIGLAATFTSNKVSSVPNKKNYYLVDSTKIQQSNDLKISCG